LTLSELAILWDLDGTIIDSTEAHFESYAAVFQQHGYAISREIFDTTFGRNTQTSLPLLLGFDPDPKLSEQIIREKEIFFRKMVPDNASLIPGVESWLATAKTKGIAQAIASSAPMKNITSILRTFNLLGYFDLLVSGANLPAKPEPDVFLTAAEQLNFPPRRCLVIEDSKPGLAAAKQAGMRCIAVVTSQEKSQLSSADLILENFNTPMEETIIGLFKDF
jgi:HAD superfamily hydrolase (TIGR01509 family)